MSNSSSQLLVVAAYMATDNLSGSKSPLMTKSEQISKVNLLTMLRLGLFQMGVSMMSILMLGVLNRVMIQELGIPATIVAVLLAMPLFVSPARVWFGQLSDAQPIFGYHRTGYIWVGAALFTSASFIALQVMWQLGSAVQIAGGWEFSIQTSGWTALLGLVFALYGVAISSSSTPFIALLVDISEEDNRSKLVGIVWSMLMVGVIVGAIASSFFLKQLTTNPPIEILQASINRLFIFIPAIVFGLAVLGTVGVEKKYSKYSSRSVLANREDGITLGRAWQIFTANRQNGLFFTFLVVMTISLFMQDPVVEPYAGQIFGMPLSQSTKLNAYSGIGTLISLSITGFFIVPRLGKCKTAQLGCLLVAICVVLLGLSGFTANPVLLKAALFLFGLAAGVTTTGAISLMLDLTAAESAGTFVGAWGLGQAGSRGIAVVAGGAVLDLGQSLLPKLVLAYGLVFAIEAVGMALAVWLLNRLDVAEAGTNVPMRIASVLETELD